jgi:hypothetical protein
MMDPTTVSVPDRTHLQRFIDAMPGGDLIGDRWAGQELCTVGVYLPDRTIPELLAAVFNAFPPMFTPGFTVSHDPRRRGVAATGGLLMQVPKMVADLLRWQPMYTTLQMDASVLRPADHGPGTEPGEELLLLWEWYLLSADVLDPLTRAHARLCGIRRDPVLADADLRQLLATVDALLDDHPGLTYDAAFEAAGMTLTDHRP